MLKFGWSHKDVSVEGPVGITGQFYERISKGVYDPNTVTALVIDDGDEVSIMMSGDFVAFSNGIIFDIRNAVKDKNPEIPVEKIMMNATHTHCSPRYMKFGTTGYDKAPHDGIDYMMPEEYRGILVDRASDAVVEAYESRSEGSYSYGYGYAVVAHHRRPTYFDDIRERPGHKGPSSLYTDKHARMYGKTDDPMFNEYEGNVDSSAYFMFTFDKSDKLTGAIINVPCPSQNSENENYLTADYWADVRAMVKEKYGDIYILPQCASAGDMSPRTLHARPAEDRKYALKYEGLDKGELNSVREICNRREIAERIMIAFDDTLKWASKEKIGAAKLSHVVKSIKLVVIYVFEYHKNVDIRDSAVTVYVTGKAVGNLDFTALSNKIFLAVCGGKSALRSINRGINQINFVSVSDIRFIGKTEGELKKVARLAYHIRICAYEVVAVVNFRTVAYKTL